MKQILTLLLLFTISFGFSQNDNPYAEFGYKGNTIKTPQERMDYMLLISNKDTISKVRTLGIDPKEEKYYLFDKDNNVIFQKKLSKEQTSRFFAVDPLSNKYPWNSPYAFSENKTIQFIELEGLEVFLSKAQRLSYGGKNKIEKTGTFIYNSGASIYNGFADIFNYAGKIDEANQAAGGSYFTLLNKGGKEKIINDTNAVANNIQNYVANTTPNEFLDDIGELATDVETYENIFGGLVGAKGLDKVGKLSKLSKVKGSGNTITLYRGVNESHPGFKNALKGKAKPRGGNASPLEHNTITTESPFTSWSTNPAVAKNYALRPNGNGIVLEVDVPISSTIKSPSLKNVQLIQSKTVPKQIMNEFEVLLKGTVKGASIKKIKN